MAKELPIKKHDYAESYFPPNIKIFGIAIGIFGLVMIYFEQLVGIIPMIFCLGIIVTQHGHFFDFDRFSRFFLDIPLHMQPLFQVVQDLLLLF